MRKSTSQYRGVHWSKQKQRWKSAICRNYKTKHLGFFINELDAHNAYQKELKKYNDENKRITGGN